MIAEVNKLRLHYSYKVPRAFIPISLLFSHKYGSHFQINEQKIIRFINNNLFCERIKTIFPIHSHNLVSIDVASSRKNLYIGPDMRHHTFLIREFLIKISSYEKQEINATGGKKEILVMVRSWITICCRSSSSEKQI